MSTASWPLGVHGISYGADYNPEQWTPDVWRDDVRLMREANVDVVALGVFAWSSLEPRRGEYTWEWLDEVIDLLHDGGIRVALGTATASPPPWLTTQHPDILPLDREGRTLSPGGRQAYSVTHPAWREAALALATRIAQRYGRHPAIAAWHLDNEMAAHVSRDYSDAAAAAFQVWLRERYATVETLNEAWATTFWSQRYSDFAEVLPPRLAPTVTNPTHELDFRRFSSETWRRWCAELAQTVREHSQGVPITTNLVPMTGSDALDLFRWRDTLDFVAIDHYTIAADPDRHIELALVADLARGLALGAPWMLAEHAPSAVNWQPVNVPKSAGDSLLGTLAHVARGADAAMFFQWRQSLGGVERFHSAMVPHAGTNSVGWRRARELGGLIETLDEVRGSRVTARVAILWDYEAWWACELPSSPSSEVRYIDHLRALYSALWRQNVTVDVRHPSDDLADYAVVLVPTLTLADPATAATLSAAAGAGAQILVTYFSGIVDLDGRVVPGGYPGIFRDLLGIRVDEFAPLLAGEPVGMDDGSAGRLWSERIEVTDAEVLRRFTSGPVLGGAALTRRSVGRGAAWYLATRLDDDDLERLLLHLCSVAGVAADQPAPSGVETIVRRDADAEFVFVLNHTDAPQSVEVGGTDLLTGNVHGESSIVPAHHALVLRRPRGRSQEPPVRRRRDG